MIQSVHPFPARMAPELALESLAAMKSGQTIADPMSGSGTVLQQAQRLGLCAVGFDLDPLAVLISKVATTPVSDGDLETAYRRVVLEANSIHLADVKLEWMDGDRRTEDFIEYWFGEDQRRDLRRLSFVLAHADSYGITDELADVLKLALSRIIVTKASAASLAQDTSHSRPHRVRTESAYDVFAGYGQSVRTMRKRIAKIPKIGRVRVGRGDARNLVQVQNDSVDMVLTSPPYLNAIDYMRGHKMSLVWLGFGIDDLTRTRSASIGAERRPDVEREGTALPKILSAMGEISNLSPRHQGMVRRYAFDLSGMLVEVARILKPGASATFVMGNSCLKGVFIQNSEGLVASAEAAGLRQTDRWERDLPSTSRYLPTPTSGALSKRMRKEVIVRVEKS